jgi:hypothetical protein
VLVFGGALQGSKTAIEVHVNFSRL